DVLPAGSLRRSQQARHRAELRGARYLRAVRLAGQRAAAAQRDPPGRGDERTRQCDRARPAVAGARESRSRHGCSGRPGATSPHGHHPRCRRRRSRAGDDPAGPRPRRRQHLRDGTAARTDPPRPLSQATPAGSRNALATEYQVNSQPVDWLDSIQLSRATLAGTVWTSYSLTRSYRTASAWHSDRCRSWFPGTAEPTESGDATVPMPNLTAPAPKPFATRRKSQRRQVAV